MRVQGDYFIVNQSVGNTRGRHMGIGLRVETLMIFHTTLPNLITKKFRS